MYVWSLGASVQGLHDPQYLCILRNIYILFDVIITLEFVPQVNMPIGAQRSAVAHNQSKAPLYAVAAQALYLGRYLLCSFFCVLLLSVFFLCFFSQLPCYLY